MTESEAIYFYLGTAIGTGSMFGMAFLVWLMEKSIRKKKSIRNVDKELDALLEREKGGL